MRLIYGTGNPAKLSAMQKRLWGFDLEIVGLKDLDIEIPEELVSTITIWIKMNLIQ